MTIQPAGSRLSGDSSDSGQLGNFLYTQGEKMLSREILALALSQPIPEEASLGDMRGKQVRDLKSFKNSDEAPLTTIKSFADFSVGRKDDALTVTYESPVPAESPVIVNAIVNAFIQYQSQPKQSSVTGLLDAYRAEKQKIEDQAGKISQQMGDLEQKYGVLSNNGDDNLQVKALTALSQQLTAAQSETRRAKNDADAAAHLISTDPADGDSSGQLIVSADDEQFLRTA